MRNCFDQILMLYIFDMFPERKSFR